jgi:hypothetical protein
VSFSATIRENSAALAAAFLWCAVPPFVVLAAPVLVTLLAFWVSWRRLESLLVRFVDPMLEVRLPRPDQNSESGTSQGLTILAFVLTQAIALAASQIGRTAISETPAEYQFKVGLLYSTLTLAVLGSVLGLIRSTGIAEADGEKGNGSYVKRSFDAGTIRFLKWVLAWGLMVSLGAGCLAWYGLLPTQIATGRGQLTWTAQSAPIPAEEDPDLQPLQDPELVGKPAVRLDVPISPSEFSEGAVPKDVVVTVALDPSVLGRGWRAIDANLYVSDPAKNVRYYPAAALNRDLSNLRLDAAPRFDVTLNNLRSAESYTLGLWLYKKGALTGDAGKYAAELNALKEKEKAVDVKATWTRY